MVGRSGWLVVLAMGCNGGKDSTTEGTVEGLAILGGGSHSMAEVVVTTIGTSDDGLAKPTDLAFHPDHADELWVVNQTDESASIFWNVGTADQQSKHADDNQSGPHFLAKPSGIAFGENGNFATIHDTDLPTQGTATPADFMGPTLWLGERQDFDGGTFSHLDMLHNSPLGKGIAWDGPGNRYWVFDGTHESITMYDFNEPHELGGEDHSDGEVARFVEGEVVPHATLPSHLEIDQESGLLYAADPGNDRIAVLDTKAGEEGDPLSGNYDGIELYEVVQVETTTLVDTAAAGLGTPVGVALHDGMVFVSSVEPDAIYAFDLDGGTVDWLELDVSPFGITFAEDGSLYVAAGKDDEILRIQAP